MSFRPFLMFLFLAGARLQARTYDLPALLNAANLDHPALTQARADAEAKAASAHQDAAWSNPTLGVSGGSRQVGDRTGPALGASISQGLFWPGKRSARLRLADLEGQAGSLRVQAAQSSLTREVLLAAAEHAAVRLHWTYALDRQEHLEPVRAFLATQTFASPQQKADRMVVETRLRNLEAERAALKVDVSTTSQALALLVHVSPEELDLAWSLSALALPTGASVSTKTWKDSPELALFRLEHEQAQASEDLAAKVALPDPEVSLSYDRADTDQGEQSLIAGLSLPLSILNTNSAGKLSASRGRIATEARIALVERELAGKERALLGRLASLDAASQVYPANVLERVEKDLEEAQRELKRGRLALISYLELESEAASTREALLTIQLERAKALIELNTLAGGTDVPAALTR